MPCYNDYPADEMKNLRLSQKDLAMIGVALIIRLLAVNKELE
jgi:hypothetical protein